MYDRVLTTAYADLGKKEILPLPEYLQKRRSRQVNDIPHKDYLIGESTATNQTDSAITPKNLDACALPEPIRPEVTKWKLFGTQGKALADLGANRLDFNEKHADFPERGNWDWTEAYLRSIGCFALCAGCNQAGVLWLQQHFAASHSRAYIWAAQRLSELLADAQLFVEISGGRTRKKMRALGKTGRKTRKDKGTGKQVRRVAELFMAG